MHKIRGFSYCWLISGACKKMLEEFGEVEALCEKPDKLREELEEGRENPAIKQRSE